MSSGFIKVLEEIGADKQRNLDEIESLRARCAGQERLTAKAVVEAAVAEKQLKGATALLERASAIIRDCESCSYSPTWLRVKAREWMVDSAPAQPACDPELPHGIPAGENDMGWPDGTPEHVKAMGHLPAQPAAPEPSGATVFEAVCQFVGSCGFACEVCADPQNHLDAKGGRGYGGHAQLLTRRRIAISPEVETLHGAAHEVAHQLAEERWGDFHNESQVAACSLWELERWALDLVCSPKRSLGAQGDADPYQMAEYVASWAHDYSVAYRRAESAEAQIAAALDQLHHEREGHEVTEQARLLACREASSAEAKLETVREVVAAIPESVFTAADEGMLDDSDAIEAVGDLRIILALLTAPSPGEGEETP